MLASVTFIYLCIVIVQYAGIANNCLKKEEFDGVDRKNAIIAAFGL
tara:strand:+ start:16194 stop:16331 length:138 start_codon:yes stop_codon:yes gene_type:complete